EPVAATALLPHQDELPGIRSTSPHSESSSVRGVGCSWVLSVRSCREFVISAHGLWGSPTTDENRVGEGVVFPAASHRDLQAFEGSAVYREGARHRRALSQSSREGRGFVSG